MTDKLKEIRDSLESITPGPWKVFRDKSLGETRIGTAYGHPQTKSPNSIVGHVIGQQGDYVYIRDYDADFIANSPEFIGYLLEEIESLRSQLQQAGLERLSMQIEANKAVEESAELLIANTAMREDIQQLYDDYARRIQSAAEILQNPSASIDQQKRVSIKRGEYRSFLAELYAILSRYPKEGETT